MAPRIHDVNGVGNVAHLRTAYTDVVRNMDVVMTVYTGRIFIRHGAGGSSSKISFQCPLLGFFRENNGTLTPGIIPIDPETEEFIGAAGMAAFSGLWGKSTNHVVGIRPVRADLFRVDLAPTNFQILAVVLNGDADAYDAEVQEVEYNVTVLHGRNGRQPGFTPPILANSPEWNGMYGAIGSAPVRSGRPSETLP